MAMLLNKNSFCQHSHATPFCIETNPRENRIFASDGQLASKKGTHNVKFITKNYTKKLCRKHARVATTQKTCRLATASASGCGGCCSPPTKATSWKSRSNLPLTARLSTCREHMEQLPPNRILKHKHGLPQTIWGNISGFYRILV